MHQEPAISYDPYTKCGGLQPPVAYPEVADLIVAYLRQVGVEYVFGIPGDAIEPFHAALARHRHGGGPQAIMACHEAGAAFMADGYARDTGKPGVCFAASGAGTTNLITGVACAYENGVPLLVLTGQAPLAAFESHGRQEADYTPIDTLSMFRHCTRYNTLVSHVKQAETKLVAALYKALQPSAGPVHLSFPLDILHGKITSAIPSYQLSALLKHSSLVDEHALDLLVKAIREAKNMVLLIGGRCAEAIGSILQFAMLKRIVFVTTQDGKTLVNHRHPLFKGVIGCGQPSADAALQDPAVELILAVGFKMNERTGDAMGASCLHGRLVHVDESEVHLERTPMARLHVRGRILTIFQLLVERLYAETDIGRTLRVFSQAFTIELDANTFDAEQASDDAGPITPRQLMHEIGRRLPPATRYLVDSGNSLVWAMHFLQPQERRVADRRLGRSRQQEKGAIDRRKKENRRLSSGRLRAAMDFAPRGYAIAAAVGVAAGNPNAPVVCITSDGGMLLNGQEIRVARIEQLTIIYVVLNESALRRFNSTPALVEDELPHRRAFATDFSAFARSLGVDAHLIQTLADLQAIDFDAACERKGPTLLDVRLVPSRPLLEMQAPGTAKQR